MDTGAGVKRWRDWELSGTRTGVVGAESGARVRREIGTEKHRDSRNWDVEER